MKKTYFTITGTQYCHGLAFMKKGMKVKLIKEPDNDFDKEAIRVEIDGAGKVGYVANSPYTVQGDSISAGRIYDKIGKKAYGKIVHVMVDGVICELKKDR